MLQNLNEKQKNYMGFLILANYEAFQWSFSLRTNLLFLKSAKVDLSSRVKKWNETLSYKLIKKNSFCKIVCYVCQLYIIYHTLILIKKLLLLIREVRPRNYKFRRLCFLMYLLICIKENNSWAFTGGIQIQIVM